MRLLRWPVSICHNIMFPLKHISSHFAFTICNFTATVQSRLCAYLQRGKGYFIKNKSSNPPNAQYLTTQQIQLLRVVNTLERLATDKLPVNCSEWTGNEIWATFAIKKKNSISRYISVVFTTFWVRGPNASINRDLSLQFWWTTLFLLSEMTVFSH